MPAKSVLSVHEVVHSLPTDFDPVAERAPSIAPPMLLQNWQVVLRWKWLIVSILVASLLLGIIVTLLMEPKYTAAARIEISREQKNITKVEGVDPTDAKQDLEFYQTQYSLLEARSVAERVARQLKLATREEFFAAHSVAPDKSGAFSTPLAGVLTPDQREHREKLAVKLLLRHILISPIRQSSLVDVTYSSASPTLSAEIANTWVRQFIQSSLDRRFDSTADARKFLEARLADLRVKVEQSERDLVNYAARKGIVSLGRAISPDGRTVNDRTLVSADLESLNNALAGAVADRVAAESRARQQVAKGAIPEALSNSAIAVLRQRRAEAAAEHAKLLVQFDSGYPKARALAEQVGALDASITKEELRVATSRSVEYGQALRREQELRAMVDQLKAQLATQQFNSIQYNIYQREADTNRQLYDALLQRYKEIGVAGVVANNISIVDSAQVPGSPSSPNLLLNLVLSFLAGIVVAGVATFALDHIDEGLRDPSQVSSALQVPLLGSVPDVEDHDALAMLSDVKSAVTEAYLTIRSNLAFSTDHGVPRTFMVTSTRAAEGKSTSALALAAVLGRTGKRVVLVDADMRSPSVHDFVGVRNDRGLSNILAGADDWRDWIKPTQFPGLDALPAGPPPPSAAELLSSDRILVFVERLSHMFDHVVIDSPPILGLADAPLLSRAVEGCVFVAEAEGVAIRGVKSALDRLRTVHGHVYGVILTKLKHRYAGYGYGYGYGQSYGTTVEKAAR